MPFPSSAKTAAVHIHKTESAAQTLTITSTKEIVLSDYDMEVVYADISSVARVRFLQYRFDLPLKAAKALFENLTND